MRRGSVSAFLAMLVACGGGGGSSEQADAAAVPPDASSPPAGCVSDSVRAQKTLNVSATVIDFVTGDPVVGATVDVSTGWDVAGGFPDECPPIATFTTNANGQIGPQAIEMGSVVDPPIILFMVHGAGWTPTASDQTVNSCTDGDCGNLGHTISVPSATVGDSWRAELAAGGMDDADARGLAVFEYRELDFMPAAGVTPNRLAGVNSVDLVPASEVRFLAADRSSLAATDAVATTTNGIAIIGVDTGAGIARVGGTRDANTWADIGVLLPPGWLFLEDRRVSQ